MTYKVLAHGFSKSFSNRIFWAALPLMLVACVTPRPFEPSNNTSGSSQAPTDPGVQTQGAVIPEAATPNPTVIQPSRARNLSPATKALVAQSQTQLNAGQSELAAATLERALRIEPDNPLLWLEFAKLRQFEGNSGQAENLARKALSMSSGDARTQAAAWRVIAEAYRARGRNPEARDADARAATLASSS
ncbi:MAG: tetratricopeptide repeat protein [Candidatus Obscuribacterales bacterium]|nr:tetratricopeptide repeat protein [Steroidobacteraceae bacterium]